MKSKVRRYLGVGVGEDVGEGDGVGEGDERDGDDGPEGLPDLVTVGSFVP